MTRQAKFLIVTLLIATHGALANESPVAEDPADDGIVPLESEIPLELDPLSVTAERMPMKQEAGFRLVRQALERKRSSRREDIDELICWFEKPIGSRMKYLYCARNGDIWAREPNPFFNDEPGLKRQEPGYGKLMRSSQPITEQKMSRILGSLPGSAELDNEFVTLALTGQDPPQDIPDDEEMDQFARAYHAVETLSESGASDDELEAAINAEGLSLKRYNRLIELVEIFQSLKNQVLERVVLLRNPAGVPPKG
jgi:hypothetical protein